MPADVAVASPGRDTFTQPRDKTPSRRSILASINPTDEAGASPTSNTDAILRSRRPDTAGSQNSNGINGNGIESPSKAPRRKASNAASTPRKANGAAAAEVASSGSVNSGSRLSVPENTSNGYANGSTVG